MSGGSAPAIDSRPGAAVPIDTPPILIEGFPAQETSASLPHARNTDSPGHRPHAPNPARPPSVSKRHCV